MMINIRGTSGAGKSTLARRIFEHYPSQMPNYRSERGNARPYSICMTGARNGRLLYVMGHYEIVCGGADTLAALGRDEVFESIKQAQEVGTDIDVFWEGVVFSDELMRTSLLARKYPLHVIWLNTPIEECIRRVKLRREAAGNFKPFNEKNTRDRVKAIGSACSKLSFNNVN